MIGEPGPFGRRSSDRRPIARIRRRLHVIAWATWSMLRAVWREFWLFAITICVAVALGLMTHVIARVDGLVLTIQDERVENTRNSCIAQNERNTETKREFDRTIPTPSAAQRRFTFRLIDRLAPYRDCEAVVQRTTGRSQEKRP